MKSQYFTTADGQQVDFVPGWFEQKNIWPLGLKNFKEFVEKNFISPLYLRPGLGSFVNKLVVLSFFIEVLRELSLFPPKRKRTLDIGTGSGIHPRLLKGAGLCQEAWGIDVADRSREFSEKDVAEYVQTVTGILHVGNEEAKKQIKTTIDHTTLDVGSEYPLYTSFKPGGSFSLDEYIVADFMDFKMGSTTFDIITGFMCIEYFDAGELFRKVASMLEPGGIFFFIVDYWYELFGSSMHLPMDAPWLHARVEVGDLLRYYEEARPEIWPWAEKAVYFEKSHMTPPDYSAEAAKAGMRPVCYRRSILSHYLNQCLYENSEMAKYFYLKVLPEAIQINPNVTESDFFTKYLTMVFVKE